MWRLKHFLIGKPLPNEELQHQKLTVFWGLPIMASDAISSVAYAVEEILWVLVMAVGLMAYTSLFYVALAIVVLLVILVISYRQTIDSYPHGGGSYTVAHSNLGEMPGLAAASSLVIDYILTVAVSITAGTAAITSAIPALHPYSVYISVAMIIFMTIVNLRGVRESSRVFAFPTYLFIVSMLVMILTGAVKVFVLGQQPAPMMPVPPAAEPLTFFLLIRAVAAGCAGLSGVEAVSNAIPNFAPPAQKHAKQVLALMALFVLLIFGGTSLMATVFHAVPNHSFTVLSQISRQIFGDGFMFYVLQVSTSVILIMAANTAYADLPMLMSLLGKDGYLPRQFSMRGGRLGFSNGIIALGIASSVLVVLFGGQTHALVPLYSVGVFISFSLSQTGMFVKWIRGKEPGWKHKALINGLGMVMSYAAVVFIAESKMLQGAWISLVLIAVFILAMKLTSRHYKDVARQLRLDPSAVQQETDLIDVQKYMIVIVGTLNKSSLKAINYARRLSNDINIVAFHVSSDEEEASALRKKWAQCGMRIPLIIRNSPYREIVGPLAEYVESEEHGSAAGDMITVVIPQFIVNTWWKNIYHNQTGYAIRKRLLHDRHIATITVPYVLDK